MPKFFIVNLIWYHKNSEKKSFKALVDFILIEKMSFEKSSVRFLSEITAYNFPTLTNPVVWDFWLLSSLPIELLGPGGLLVLELFGHFHF